MDYIRIKGLRSLVDTKPVSIRPINILVGANSSGKSTFLRTFPLLRQSVERKTRGPILWNGVYADFESFLTSLHQDTTGTEEAKEISFEFSFDVLNFSRWSYRGIKNDKPIKITAGISIVKGSTKNSCYTNKYHIDLFGHEIFFEFDEDGTISQVSSSRLTWDLKRADLKYQRTNTDSLLPIIKLPDFSHFRGESKVDTISRKLYDHIRGLIREHSGSSSENKVSRFASILLSEFASDIDKLKLMRTLRSTKKWNHLVDYEWNEDDSDFTFLTGLIDLFLIIENSVYINSQFSELLRNVRYIAPLRASTERYYRYQDLSIHELEHTGANIGIFLSNVAKKWRASLDEWTMDNFGFKIKDKVSSGHIAIELEYGSTISDNIADMGFGYSQVLPVIVQLWSVASGYESSLQEKSSKAVIFVIEQPELHLHPKMQASLAKVFSESIKLASNNKIDLRLIVETHSPSMISKFGDMIAMEEMEEDSISVLLFERDHKSRSTSLKSSYFNGDGELMNWPADFFTY